MRELPLTSVANLIGVEKVDGVAQLVWEFVPGRTLEEILHHIAEDSLVLTGWNPADGRSKPPLVHAEFAAKMREWVKKGAAIPE